MTIIAAITRDLAIGRNGDMIYHISADLKRFKALTMGHPLVMGRRTFESFPNGPLPGRLNIVITSNPAYSPKSTPQLQPLPPQDKAITPPSPQPSLKGKGIAHPSLQDALEGKGIAHPSLQDALEGKAIIVVPSLQAALEIAGKDAMIIGGGQIYAQAMPLADTLEITEIDAEAPDADTRFPAIDPAKWQIAKASPWQTAPNTPPFRYLTYLPR
ncbi:MAG: dihydrofolate reductase [Clostridium sp.]|nr:dihydrofolate reductase [Clostridium sp.]